MCLAIPVKVLDISENTAQVDFKGEKKEVYTELVKPKRGDWVLVYANQVLEIVPKERALEIIKSMEDAC